MSRSFNYFLIDLDDTLYDYHQCHKIGVEGFIKYCTYTFHLTEQKVSDLYKSSRTIINHRLNGQAASHSRLLYAKEFCEQLKLDPVYHAINMENSYWAPFLYSMKLRDGVENFLNKLKSLDKKTALVTDLTTEIQLKKLNTLKISQYFDTIVTSEEAGAEKPSHIIFQLAADKLNLNKEESIMIGDNYKKDILGARSFGISALLFGTHVDEADSIQSFNQAIDRFIQ